MISTAHIQVNTTAGDEAFLPPVPAELIAARSAKRDYIICLCVAMVTPVVMFILASMLG